MATYGVVNTAKCKFTKDGNIRSAKYYVGTTATAIENGRLVQVDTLLDASNNREIFKALAPTAVTALNMGIVCTPEVIYDESLTSTGALDQFINAAGKPITVGILTAGDEIDISDTAIIPINDDDDVPAVGSYVTITANDTKWTEKTSLGGTETVYGKIINRFLYKADKYMNTVLIIKAN